MKIIPFYFLCMYLPMTMQGMEWRDIFKKYDILLKNEACQIIIEQYNAFTQNTAPVIAHSTVKIIPIVESQEPLIDLKIINHPRIQMLPDPCLPFNSPFCNSGFKNSSKIRLSLFKKLEYMIDMIDEYAPQFGFVPGQISIKVFEGLRDLQTQKYLYDKKKNEIKSMHPEYTDIELDSETSKWISPVYDNIPAHSTGAAIDLYLFDNNIQEMIDMGIFGAIWEENRAAPTYFSHISEKQKLNRFYLQLCAALAGLTNYVFEWWHFSYGDKYAAYWQEKNPSNRYAIYGAIE